MFKQTPRRKDLRTKEPEDTTVELIKFGRTNNSTDDPVMNNQAGEVAVKKEDTIECLPSTLPQKRVRKIKPVVECWDNRPPSKCLRPRPTKPDTARKSPRRPTPRKRYEVEAIVGEKTYLLVKWKGYSLKEATWEPEDRLKEDCPNMVAEYSWLYRNYLN